jgi:hypothetical protein
MEFPNCQLRKLGYKFMYSEFNIVKLDFSGSDDISRCYLDPFKAILKSRINTIGEGTRLLQSEGWAVYLQSIQSRVKKGSVYQSSDPVDVVYVVVS